MWIFSIPSAFRLPSLSIGPGFGQRPICDMRVDGPEGEISFVRHFHFVWALSGPLTISLESREATRARVVAACVFPPGFVLHHLLPCAASHKRLTVDLVILRSPLGDDLIGRVPGPLDPVSVSTSKVVVDSEDAFYEVPPVG
jgi:hypothetical protein